MCCLVFLVAAPSATSSVETGACSQPRCRVGSVCLRADETDHSQGWCGVLVTVVPACADSAVWVRWLVVFSFSRRFVVGFWDTPIVVDFCFTGIVAVSAPHTKQKKPQKPSAGRAGLRSTHSTIPPRTSFGKTAPYTNPIMEPIGRTPPGTMFQIKGRAWVRAIIVPVSSITMNSGDAFVFDTHKGIIYCWIGSKCIKTKMLKVLLPVLILPVGRRSGACWS